MYLEKNFHSLKLFSPFFP